MANLWSGKIATSGEYQKLETIASISLTNDSVYTIQVIGGCMLCESATKPTSGGFLVYNIQPVQYKKTSGNDLYVKNESYDCTLNIAE